MSAQHNASLASNPYAPPAAIVEDQLDEDSHAGNYIPGGRKCSAGRGAAWIGSAWKMFTDCPGRWIALAVLNLACALAFDFLLDALPPKHVLGTIFSPVVTALLTGGLIIACAEHRRTGQLDIGKLFEAIGTHGGPLVILALLEWVLMIVCLVPVGIGAAIVIPMVSAGDLAQTTILTLGLIGVLLAVAAILFASSAAVFSPALIVLHDVSPFQAIKSSLQGGLKNWVASLLCGVLMVLIMIASMIPVGLGLFISYPLMLITLYTSYRDIFTES